MADKDLTDELDKVRALMRRSTKYEIKEEEESILLDILKQQLRNAIAALPDGETEFGYKIPVLSATAMWILFEERRARQARTLLTIVQNDHT